MRFLLFIFSRAPETTFLLLLPFCILRRVPSGAYLEIGIISAVMVITTRKVFWLVRRALRIISIVNRTRVQAR